MPPGRKPEPVATAAAIAASRQPQYGSGETKTEGLSSAYEMSGHNAVLWGRATEAEVGREAGRGSSGGDEPPGGETGGGFGAAAKLA